MSGESHGDVLEALAERPIRLPSLDEEDPCPFFGAIHLRGIPSEAGLGHGTESGRLSEGPIYLAFPAIPRNIDLLPPRTSTLRGSNCGGQARSRHRASPTSDSKW
jgi:hypothetical protein